MEIEAINKQVFIDHNRIELMHEEFKVFINPFLQGLYPNWIYTFTYFDGDIQVHYEVVEVESIAKAYVRMIYNSQFNKGINKMYKLEIVMISGTSFETHLNEESIDRRMVYFREMTNAVKLVKYLVVDGEDIKVEEWLYKQDNDNPIRSVIDDNSSIFITLKDGYVVINYHMSTHTDFLFEFIFFNRYNHQNIICGVQITKMLLQELVDEDNYYLFDKNE